MKKSLSLLLLFIPFFLKGQTISIATSSDTICIGSHVLFIATTHGLSLPHYQWLKNGINTGNDTAAYITDSLRNNDAISCLLKDSTGAEVAKSDSIIMTAQHPLSAGVITGKDSVCEFATITLTDTATTGVWISGYHNADVSNGIVTGLHAIYSEGGSSPAKDYIYYITTNSCGSDTANYLITIMPRAIAYGIPLYVYGNSNICLGPQSLGGDGIFVDGNFYSVFGHAKIISYGDFIDLIGLTIGTDTVLNVDSNYCGIDSLWQPITILPNPSAGTIITPSNGICPGDSVHLLDTGYIGNQGNWTCSNHNAQFFTDTGNITGIKPGLDTISISYANTCGNATATAILTINPDPVINLGYDTLCSGTIMTAKADSIGGGLWSGSNNSIASVTAASGIISGMDTGTATITYTAPTGCYATKDITVVGCNNVAGIDYNNYVSVYPNPAHDNLEIHTYIDDYQFCSVSDCFGRVVIDQAIAGRYTYISTTQLAPGIYFLRTWGGGKTAILKFIKG